MLNPLRITGVAAIIALGALALAGTSQAAASADDTVIAIVNGDKILKKDVLGAMKNLPMQGANTEQVFPLVVDQIINEKLLDTATTAAKVSESEDYKKRLDVLKSQLVKQIYIEKFLSEKVTDKAIKSEYDQFRKENKGKTEIHARHILVPSEEEAKKAILDLDGGAKFEDIATKRSSGPTAQNGGDLGYFVKEDMIPEFSEAAFKLKPGTYTKTPVKTQFGWHVIKVEDKRERKVPEMKEVEAAIRSKLTQDAVRGLVENLRAKAEIKLFDMDGKPVGDAAKN